MEEEHVFTGDDVGDAIAIISDRSEPTTARDALRVLHQVQLVCLGVRRLETAASRW